jgi:excisionase family DNA binding protein
MHTIVCSPAKLELLTIREVADMLRIHPATAYRMIDRGDLEAVSIGRGPRPRLRIPSESVSALVSGKAP